MLQINSNSEDVSRIFDRYSPCLCEEECTLITILSALRGPLDETYVKEITPIIGLRDDSIGRLIEYGILSYNPSTQFYFIHQLVRQHYQKKLKEDADMLNVIHEFLFNYYLSIDANIKTKTSLNHLRPLIEAVYHGCMCGRYSDALRTYNKNINTRGDHLLTDQLGAYDTALSIMREFFPDGDLEEAPNPKLKNKEVCQILGNVGFYLMSLGYLGDSLSVLERELILSKKMKYRIKQSNGYQNLSRLQIHLGELEKATVSARKGIKAAEKTHANRRTITRHRINSICILAWCLHLRGYSIASGDLFQKARRLNEELGESDVLTKFRGIFNISHLTRQGNLQEARALTRANLEASESTKELAQISRCYRLLGDLDALEGDIDSALEHYESALEFAREITRKEILIEALLSRGRFTTEKSLDPVGGYGNLSEALTYATDSGYRLYEVDIRCALAYALLVKGDVMTSENEAQYARQVSQSKGYYWGDINATCVLSLTYRDQHH